MTENEQTVVEHNSLALIERAQIDAQIATAQMYPKHAPNMLSAVKANMLSFATLDEDTAAGCFYTLPRGGKAIQGPSIRMAEIAISCYGNIRDSVRVIDVVANSDTPHVVVQAVCHDLESNVAVSIEKRRRITKKKRNKTVDEDDINLAVNACTAIAFRDAAFKVIPLALIKPVVAAAKKVAIGDIRSLDATRQKCIERLNQMGVPTDRVLAVVNCLKAEDIGQNELEILFGLGTALKDGDTSIEESFPKIVPQEKAGVSGLTDRLRQQTKAVTPPKEEPAPVTQEQSPDVAPMNLSEEEQLKQAQEKANGKKKGRPKGSKNKPKETTPEEPKEPEMTIEEVQESPMPADVIPETPPEVVEPEPEKPADKLLDETLEKKYTCKKCNHSFDEGNVAVGGGILCPICFAKQ